MASTALPSVAPNDDSLALPRQESYRVFRELELRVEQLIDPETKPDTLEGLASRHDAPQGLQEHSCRPHCGSPPPSRPDGCGRPNHVSLHQTLHICSFGPGGARPGQGRRGGLKIMAQLALEIPVGVKPPAAPWSLLRAAQPATGYLSMYLADDLSWLPVRHITRPHDNKSDPNIETGTYGLFSTCEHQMRSGIVNRGAQYIVFMCRWGGPPCRIRVLPADLEGSGHTPFTDQGGLRPGSGHSPLCQPTYTC